MKRTKNTTKIVDLGIFEKPKKIIHIAMENNKKGKIFYYDDIQKTNQSIWEFFQQFCIQEKARQNIVHKHIMNQIQESGDTPQIYLSIKTNSSKSNQLFKQALKDEKNVVKKKDTDNLKKSQNITITEDLNEKSISMQEKNVEPEDALRQSNFFYRNRYKSGENSKGNILNSSGSFQKAIKDRI